MEEKRIKISQSLKDKEIEYADTIVNLRSKFQENETTLKNIATLE